jgi:hypothetical protein
MLHPVRKAAMLYVRCGPFAVEVAAIDANVSFGGGRQLPHITVVCRIFDQVIDNIERERQVRLNRARFETRYVKELLGPIAFVSRPANVERPLRDVQPDVFSIASERELRPVATAEFRDTVNPMFAHEPVDDVCLEQGQPPMGTGSRVSSLFISILPILRRGTECDPRLRLQLCLTAWPQPATDDGSFLKGANFM